MSLETDVLCFSKSLIPYSIFGKHITFFMQRLRKTINLSKDNVMSRFFQNQKFTSLFTRDLNFLLFSNKQIVCSHSFISIIHRPCSKFTKNTIFDREWNSRSLKSLFVFKCLVCFTCFDCLDCFDTWLILADTWPMFCQW